MCGPRARQVPDSGYRDESTVLPLEQHHPPNRLDVVFQVSVAPSDLLHVRHILPHQISRWRGQVSRIILTVDTLPGRGRYAQAWDDSRVPLQSLLDTVVAANDGQVAVVPVDYSSTCVRAVSHEFLGGRDVPLKDSYGAPFYAYLFGLMTADARYVLHADADILYGGGSGTWLTEAVTVLRERPDVLLTGPYPGPPTSDGRIPCEVTARHAASQRHGSPPELLRLTDHALRFAHMSTRSFLIDLDRFRAKVGVLHPEYTPAPRSSRQSPGAAPLEVWMSKAMRQHGLVRVDLLGADPGMWVLHPPYRGKAFLRDLPDLIARIERGDIPEAQLGDYDLNDSMVDWSRPRRLQRWRARGDRIKRLATAAGDLPRLLTDLRRSRRA
jgi:hypothetical protein